MNVREELLDLWKITGEHTDDVLGTGHGKFKNEMIASGLHIVLNPLFTERGNGIADGNRVAASPSRFEVLLTRFFTQRTAAKLFRDERHAADRAELKTSAILDITSRTVLECGWMRLHGMLCRKRLDDQLRFATGAGREKYGASGRAVVADLRRRGPGRSSGQRGCGNIQGPIKIIGKHVNRGCAMRDGANQAAKGTLRTGGNPELRKSVRYRVKLDQVAAAPQEPRRISAHLLGRKRGNQCGPAGGAFLDFFAVFSCAQRAILHGFLV